MSQAIPILIQNDTPKRRSRHEKTEALVNEFLYKNITFEKAAQNVGIPHATAYRYWKKWKETGEASKVDAEWWRTYKRIKRKNPELAFAMLTKLKLKQTVAKMEIKEDVKVLEKHAIAITTNLSEYDAAVEEELNRILKANRSGQPVDSDNP